ncbi:Nod factor hydrolase protein 1 [Heracleum sosnowskyi]|uniref:Nod factor hydrolase protein 1 n=1 Tax=Heracleum sosnowskyi TaxID=360622 RepID=A0AAD8JI71_9APIA|nr:Nod factor hydrolase protein 1 [Heracleum sosnowskyi]
MAVQTSVLLFLAIVAPTVLAYGGVKGAYWPSWVAETLSPATIPTSYFTHLFYAFVEVDSATCELNITQPDDQWMGNFTATLHAKSPPAKAFLSIGGTNTGTIFSYTLSSHKNRAAFINSTIVVARKYGFDGLDLDWEFPNNTQDMSNLATFFTAWRFAIDKEARFSGKQRILLSAAVYFSSALFLTDPPLSYPGHVIKKYIDFVSPMTYDLHGSWEPLKTGSPALLYDKYSNLSTSYGISSWLKSGVPSEKVVMGLPMYGRSWQLVNSSDHNIGSPAVGAGPLPSMTYDQIVDFNLGNNATVVYDEATVSTYSYAGKNWIGYDNVESVVNKVKFAKDQGLGGYFFWAIGDDKNWTLAAAGEFLYISESIYIL